MSAPNQWYAVERIKQRSDQLMRGGRQGTFHDYVEGTWLPAGRPLRALSLGCGAGERECRWARTGRFESIAALDISTVRIEAARARAAEAGLDQVLAFAVSDVEKDEWHRDRYDVVLLEHALHHLRSTADILRRAADCLADDGILVLDDFVGPTRFQWTDRQLEASNALITLLPQRLRRLDDGRVKRRVVRPSLATMLIRDPSEAVDSAGILPGLEASFEILARHDYGGTVLHLLLSDIARNFMVDDPDAAQWLELLIAVEDGLLASGELSSDFTVVIGRPRRRGLAPARR